MVSIYIVPTIVKGMDYGPWSDLREIRELHAHQDEFCFVLRLLMSAG